MNDDKKRTELIRMVLGKDWEPHKQYPATLHNRLRREDPGESSHLNNHDAELPVQYRHKHSLLSRLVGMLSLRLS